MSYSQNPARLAAPRMNAAGLISQLQFVARRLYFSAPTASPRNRAFLQEFASGEGRYQLVALQRLIECSRLSLRPEDREAIAEVIRGQIVDATTVTQDVRIVGRAELAAQCEHDVAWNEFAYSLCRASRERAIQTGTAHLVSLRAQIDTLHAHRSAM